MYSFLSARSGSQFPSSCSMNGREKKTKSSIHMHKWVSFYLLFVHNCPQMNLKSKTGRKKKPNNCILKITAVQWGFWTFFFLLGEFRRMWFYSVSLPVANLGTVSSRAMFVPCSLQMTAWAWATADSPRGQQWSDSGAVGRIKADVIPSREWVLRHWDGWQRCGVVWALVRNRAVLGASIEAWGM